MGKNASAANRQYTDEFEIEAECLVESIGVIQAAKGVVNLIGWANNLFKSPSRSANGAKHFTPFGKPPRHQCDSGDQRIHIGREK